MSPDTTTRHKRRAFTLVETVTALGVMAILLVGMAGALTLSTTAVDAGRDRSSQAVRAAAATDMVLADLNEATAIAARSHSEVELTVPDRNGDSTPETIMYRWGAVGSPLYRAVNGDEHVLLPVVDQFTIDLMGRSGPSSTDSSEQVLASFDTSSGASIKSVMITDKAFAAQYLKPAFADNVDSWTITRLRLRLSRDATAAATLRISIVRDDRWTPTGAVLARLDIPEASLPSTAAWVDVAISAGPLSPNDGVYIRLEESSGPGNAGAVEYGSGGSTMPYNTFLTLSSDAGATWSAPTDSTDLRFYAYGTVSSH